MSSKRVSRPTEAAQLAAEQSRAKKARQGERAAEKMAKKQPPPPATKPLARRPGLARPAPAQRAKAKPAAAAAEPPPAPIVEPEPPVVAPQPVAAAAAAAPAPQVHVVRVEVSSQPAAAAAPAKLKAAQDRSKDRVWDDEEEMTLVNIRYNSDNRPFTLGTKDKKNVGLNWKESVVPSWNATYSDRPPLTYEQGQNKWQGIMKKYNKFKINQETTGSGANPAWGPFAVIDQWEGGKTVRANRESMLLESGGRVQAPPAAAAAAEDEDDADETIDLTADDQHVAVKREPKPSPPRAARNPTPLQRVAAAAEETAKDQKSTTDRMLEQMAQQHKDVLDVIRLLLTPPPAPVQQPVFAMQPPAGASVFSSPPRLEPQPFAFSFAPAAAAAAAAHIPSVIGSDDATALGTQAAHAARALEATFMGLPRLPTL